MTDRRRTTTLLIMGILLVVGVILSFFVGKYAISPKELLGIIASEFVDIEPFWEFQKENILWQIRMPRVVTACLVGAALSVAGAVYQGVFENPMAAPDFLGASSGAAFGAALAIILGFGGGMITVLAFCFSIATIWIVYLIGNRTKGSKTVGLVLAGLMVSALAQAGTSFIKLVADQQNQLPAITYWLMGSLTSITPENMIFAALTIIAGLIPVFILRWKINILTVGEQEAKTMGVNVNRVRLISLTAATLLTAAAVSVSGMIGWVGLVVPHLCRKIIGNNNKYLIPASTLTGALFLLMVDNVSRTLFEVEIPIGILTAIIGAPFFIYLITRGGAEQC